MFASTIVSMESSQSKFDILDFQVHGYPSVEPIHLDVDTESAEAEKEEEKKEPIIIHTVTETVQKDNPLEKGRTALVDVWAAHRKKARYARGLTVHLQPDSAKMLFAQPHPDVIAATQIYEVLRGQPTLSELEVFLSASVEKLPSLEKKIIAAAMKKRDELPLFERTPADVAIMQAHHFMEKKDIEKNVPIPLHIEMPVQPPASKEGRPVDGIVRKIFTVEEEAEEKVVLPPLASVEINGSTEPENEDIISPVIHEEVYMHAGEQERIPVECKEGVLEIVREDQVDGRIIVIMFEGKEIARGGYDQNGVLDIALPKELKRTSIFFEKTPEEKAFNDALKVLKTIA